MEIVIKIPKEYYNAIKAIPDNQCTFDMLVIKNGKQLPKGHGRLIDLEEVRDRYFNIIKVSNSELESLRMLAEILDTAPTIIEKDKGSEE